MRKHERVIGELRARIEALENSATQARTRAEHDETLAAQLRAAVEALEGSGGMIFLGNAPNMMQRFAEAGALVDGYEREAAAREMAERGE